MYPPVSATPDLGSQAHTPYAWLWMLVLETWIYSKNFAT